MLKIEIAVQAIASYGERGYVFFMSDKDLGKEIRESSEEVGEDSTKYGEFISSYFAWVSLPKQKEKVEELENITKKKDKERKKQIFNKYETEKNEESQRKSKKEIDLFFQTVIIILQVKESQR